MKIIVRQSMYVLTPRIDHVMLKASGKHGDGSCPGRACLESGVTLQAQLGYFASAESVIIVPFTDPSVALHHTRTVGRGRWPLCSARITD